MAMSTQSDKTSRFTDIVDEPVNRLLSPIRGYEDQQLLPLTQTIESVSGYFNDIGDYIYVALHNCQNPADDLTQQESASIQLYTMQFHGEPNLYNLLNQSLRAENREELKPWFAFLKLFLTALHKLPSQFKTVWRGVKNVDLSAKYKAGTKFVWWGVSSCTTHIEILESDEFLGKDGLRTIFSIQCINGKSIANHSYYKNAEREIILMPGSYFEVIGQLNPTPQLHIIQLKEITPPITFIKPPFSKPTNINSSAVINKSDTYFPSTPKIIKRNPLTNVFSKAISVKSNTKWEQDGITVAGGNGEGYQLNQLCRPNGIFIDSSDQTIYIADHLNYRIVEWKYNATNGQIVAGGNGRGNQTNQLYYPKDVIIDKENNSLIISDCLNRRVMRWSRRNNTKNGEIIISDINSYGLTMDKDGSLYVCDWIKNEVRRWKRGDKEGRIVAGGNGNGHYLNQLSSPTFIFVDEDYSLYVSDRDNHRVMKWVKDAKEGVVVAGGNGKGNRLTQLFEPEGVIVDQLGQIYVADFSNHRVMRWCEGAKEGTIVVGGYGKEEQSNQLYGPTGLAFDRQGNLYVADNLNNRIQKFEIDNESTELKFAEPLQELDDNENIMVICLDVKFDDKNLFSICNFENFDNEFEFISRTLSIKDKILFLIISTAMGDYVIPLIHKHLCIEKIYLFGSTDTKSSPNWSSMSTKINYPCADLKQLCDQITEEIKTTRKRPLCWNRSASLFTMLHTQQFSVERKSIIEIPINILANECIIIFHCDELILMNAKIESSSLHEFMDVEKCVQFITEQLEREIFLVISGKTVPSALESILNFKQIHAIYYFCPLMIKYPIDRRKVSGLFHKSEDLVKQLNNDISFFREQHMHISQIDVFKKIDSTKKLLSQLNDKQIDFIKLNLFLDILQQTPLLEMTPENIINECKKLFNRTENKPQIIFNIDMLPTENERLNWFEQYPEFCQIILRLHQLNEPHNLFLLQKQFVNIQKQVLESSEVSLPLTVYLTKIISKNDLDMLQSNYGEFISIGIFLLSTKSLVTARNIARQAANNGLISVLFEIKVDSGVHLFNIDFDRVIFRLGAIFRLESVNLAPDGVRYVKIKCADSEFQIIKKQIQFEIGINLSWLTFGNYLYFLNRFKQAIDYFNYLLEKLLPEHIDRSSVSRNMELIYATSKDDADKSYIEVLKYAKPISSVFAIDESDDESYTQLPITYINLPETTVHYSTLFGNMADVYFNKSEYVLALKYYEKAFESSIEPLRCSYYQRMIITIKKRLNDS